LIEAGNGGEILVNLSVMLHFTKITSALVELCTEANGQTDRQTDKEADKNTQNSYNFEVRHPRCVVE